MNNQTTCEPLKNRARDITRLAAILLLAAYFLPSPSGFGYCQSQPLDQQSSSAYSGSRAVGAAVEAADITQRTNFKHSDRGTLVALSPGKTTIDIAKGMAFHSDEASDCLVPNFAPSSAPIRAPPFTAIH